MFLFLLENPRELLRRCLRALRPVGNGRVEFQGMRHPYRRDVLGEDTPTMRLSRLRVEDAAKCELGRTMAGRLDEMMREAGYVDVESREYRVPIGGWMAEEGERMKEAGEKYQECLRIGMVGFSKMVMMRGLGWTEKQVLDACEEVVADLGKGRVFATIRVVTGRRPKEITSSC